MDNVTHSLAGLLLAEAAVQFRPRLTGEVPSRSFRAAAAISSVVAANLPDADLLYTGVGADPLTYMLHHRGFSHTVVIALLGALLLWVAALPLLRWRASAAPTSDDRRWLLVLLVVSAMSHLVLDWTNSYGLHPFWPFDDRWFYGDSVFIVEPWFWVVSVPVLVAATTRRVARVLLSLILVIGLALAWRVSLVTTGAAALLTIGAVISIAIARVLRPSRRVGVAVGAWIVVTVVMAAGSASARAETLRAAHEADREAEVLDVVVSPLPANAVCMNVITVERSGAAYRVASARVSSAPSMVAASSCGAPRGVDASFRKSARRATRAVQWDTEWTAPSGELASLAHKSCVALAALGFIRVPVWQAPDDSALMLGDARFGGAGRGFSVVRVPRRPERCPANVPPWVPPRAELLERSPATAAFPSRSL
ncbi:MAG: metal-dependent hydrolase [Gemmatimonadaceae bacterium]